jgi:glutaredoxin 3
MEVTVYSSPTCPHCRAAKDYLAQRGVKFKEIDISSDPGARRELLAVAGQIAVPAIVVDGEVVIGFNRPALDAALAGKAGPAGGMFR